MWVRTNPNPKHKHVPDCVIRALAIVLNKTWYQVYDDLYLSGRRGRDSIGRYTSMNQGPTMSGHWPGPPPAWSSEYASMQRGYPPDTYWR